MVNVDRVLERAHQKAQCIGFENATHGTDKRLLIHENGASGKCWVTQIPSAEWAEVLWEGMWRTEDGALSNAEVQPLPSISDFWRFWHECAF